MPSEPNWGNQSFWVFSLDVYARPGITDACLSLQDQYGCDVNILLFCCWTASVGPGRLNEATLENAIAGVKQWQIDVIKPIRAIRRGLEAKFTHVDPITAAELREEISATELQAERVEQKILEKLSVSGGPGRRDYAAQLENAQHNLFTYLKLIGTEHKKDALKAISTIVDGCFTSAESR